MSKEMMSVGYRPPTFKAALSKSVTDQGYNTLWSNGCFRLAQYGPNHVTIVVNEKNPAMEFLKLVSPEYSYGLSKVAHSYGSTSYKLPIIFDKSDPDTVVVDTSLFPLRWMHMITDFTDLPVTVVADDEDVDNVRFDSDKITNLLKVLPDSITDMLYNQIISTRPNCELEVYNAPIAPSEYEEHANDATSRWIYGNNDGTWDTGNGSGSPGTQYVLTETNKFKSTGTYRTVFASEGGLEIFSYYLYMMKNLPGPISYLGAYEGDCRGPDTYTTHNWHGKYISYEELVVMQLAFEKLGCDCEIVSIEEPHNKDSHRLRSN